MEYLANHYALMAMHKGTIDHARHMSKEELIEMLKIANCDINTIIFAINAWEMGYEHAQKEQHDASSDILG